jgi:hypothetical protein
MSDVTPIRPDVGVSKGPKRKRRPPSLNLSDLEAAIDEQRFRCWESAAIVESVALALKDHFGGDWPAGVPEFHRALHVVARTMSAMADDLEPGPLEERAKQIAAGENYGR